MKNFTGQKDQIKSKVVGLKNDKIVAFNLKNKVEKLNLRHTNPFMAKKEIIKKFKENQEIQNYKPDTAQISSELTEIINNDAAASAFDTSLYDIGQKDSEDYLEEFEAQEISLLKNQSERKKLNLSFSISKPKNGLGSMASSFRGSQSPMKSVKSISPNLRRGRFQNPIKYDEESSEIQSSELLSSVGDLGSPTSTINSLVKQKSLAITMTKRESLKNMNTLRIVHENKIKEERKRIYQISENLVNKKQAKLKNLCMTQMDGFIEQYLKLHTSAMNMIHNEEKSFRMVIEQENILVQRKIVEDLIKTLGQKIDEVDDNEDKDKIISDLEDKVRKLEKQLSITIQDFETMKIFNLDFTNEKNLLDRIQELEKQNQEIKENAQNDINEMKSQFDKLHFRLKSSISQSRAKEKELEDLVKAKDKRIEELLTEIEWIKASQINNPHNTNNHQNQDTIQSTSNNPNFDDFPT
ncbi:unnamed protein product [Moneuplotes crassus]|uniref:Uncharacterized protein n=1 Tax=Euplotes crassus TaxID=5936 RepID=A0AAD1YAA4_EUPCR|nr:unnamed protein product [Moneuplotes crassus]